MGKVTVRIDPWNSWLMVSALRVGMALFIMEEEVEGANALLQE